MKYLIIVLLMTFFLASCTEYKSELMNVDEYELVNLNGKMYFSETATGVFFVFIGAYTQQSSSKLYYSFFYKHKNGSIEFEKLDAENDSYDKVYIVEKDNILNAKYRIEKWSKDSPGFYPTIKRYLIVPKGTIVGAGKFSVDINN